MKTIVHYTVTLFCCALLSAPVLAEPTPAPPHGGMGMMGMMGGGMNDQHMRQMQDQMLKMHDMMHQIRDAKNDAERNRLKDEQLKLMKEHHDNMMQMMMPMMQHGQNQGAPAGHDAHQGGGAKP
ncbi:MAG: hypothetical protein EPN21_09060 [Methylococcaceae bacterium]|nr:MAG: hypothetical protein EPN21_09060 [Methylococcaceae bacterium]